MAKRNGGGIEGSGYDYNDRVLIDDGSEDGALAHVRGIHAGGKKLDVQIDKKRHSEHGRTITVNTNDVSPAPEGTLGHGEEPKPEKAAAKQE